MLAARLIQVCATNTLWLLAILSFSTGVACANDEQAIQLYLRAQELEADAKYPQAIEYYTKALQARAAEGRLLIETRLSTETFEFGRSAKQSVVDRSQFLDYRPQQRIRELNLLVEERDRRAHPPRLSLRWVAMRDPTHDDVLDGGETAEIVLEISNSGKSNASDIGLVATSDDSEGLLFEHRSEVGMLAANESKSVSFNISALRQIENRNRVFKIKAVEELGFDSNEVEVIIHTRAHRPEKIVLSEPELRDFNGDNRIEAAEMIDVETRIHNLGEGISSPLQVNLELGENIFLGPDDSKHFKVNQIVPGESELLSFSFITNRRVKHNANLPITIRVSDENGTELVAKKVNFSVFVPKEKARVELTPKLRDEMSHKTVGTLDIEVNIPKLEKKDEYAVAVIIGNKHYQSPGVPAVKYAANDAALMKQYVINTLGFSAQNVLYIEDATSAKFSETFGTSSNYAGWLYNFVKPEKSEVFIYYSGHGAPDLKSKSMYFVPVDANPNYLSNSGYPLSVFFQNLSKLKAKKITVVLDTCFSGDSDGGFLFKNISPIYIEAQDAMPSIPNAAVFSSSLNSQVSTWYHEKRHGLFTYYFLKGLRGDADINRDRQITTTELNAFVMDRVPFKARRLNGNEQTPSLKQRQEYVLVNFQQAQN